MPIAFVDAAKRFNVLRWNQGNGEAHRHKRSAPLVRARTSVHGDANAFWKLAHFVDELGSRYFAVKNRFVSAINDLVQPIEKQTWQDQLQRV